VTPAGLRRNAPAGVTHDRRILVIRTAKAYAAAIGALAAALTPLLPEGPARWIYALLAILAALGITWRVPNADPGHADSPGGVLGVLDKVPALIGGLLGGRTKPE
jgi:hypothetical protein